MAPLRLKEFSALTLVLKQRFWKCWTRLCYEGRVGYNLNHGNLRLHLFCIISLWDCLESWRHPVTQWNAGLKPNATVSFAFFHASGSYTCFHFQFHLLIATFHFVLLDVVASQDTPWNRTIQGALLGNILQFLIFGDQFSLQIVFQCAQQ